MKYLLLTEILCPYPPLLPMYLGEWLQPFIVICTCEVYIGWWYLFYLFFFFFLFYILVYR